MTCDQIHNEIPLYYYGELGQEEEERVEQHLVGCQACEAELARVRAFGRTMTVHEAAVPEHLVYDARAALSRAIRAERKVEAEPGGWLQHLKNWMNLGVGFRIPAGALALVAVGFLAGKVAPGTLPFVNSGAQQAGFISVRSVEPDASGGVKIAFERIARDSVSGSVEDPKIRQLLLSSMNDQSNSGLRVEAVDIAKNHAQDADVRTALMEALQGDPNPGVRMQALQGLHPYAADPVVRKALKQALLNDANAGIRVKVIDLLTEHKDDSMVAPLQTLMEKEQNPYIRSRATSALRDMKASIGTF
jgi:hypothetical protein